MEEKFTKEGVVQALDYVANRINLAWMTAVRQVIDDPALQAKVVLAAGFNTISIVEADEKAMNAAMAEGTLDNLSAEEIASLFPKE